MQEYLITHDEVSTLAREVSQHLERQKIETYIREAENIEVRKALGDDLFIAIKQNPEQYTLLLEGGTYESCGGLHMFQGLKTALAYYSYARIIKNGDNHVTRFGFVQKEDEYSRKPESKDKVIAYNDAMSVANSYMKECLDYLVATKTPLYKGEGIKSNVVQFRIIGE